MELGISTRLILHGPREEVITIESPSFQTTTCTLSSSASSVVDTCSQDEQTKRTAVTTWLAGLDLDLDLLDTPGGSRCGT